MVTSPVTLCLEGLNSKKKQKTDEWYNYKKDFPKIYRILHSLGEDHYFFSLKLVTT